MRGNFTDSLLSTCLFLNNPVQASWRAAGPCVLPVGPQRTGKASQILQPSRDPLLFLLSDFLPPLARRAWMSQKGGAPTWQDPILLAGSFSGAN